MRPQIQHPGQGSVADKPRTSSYTSLSVATLQVLANEPGHFYSHSGGPGGDSAISTRAGVLSTRRGAPSFRTGAGREPGRTRTRIVCSSEKLLCGSLPFISWLFLFPFLLYFFTSGGTVEAFTAYDCQNRSNRVTSYSLIEPESCHSHVTDLRFVRVLSAEIIQVKKTRIVPVHRCLAVESEFSQYCGHSSAAGVLRILKFRENRGIDSADCRKAFLEKGKITVGGKMADIQ